MIRKIFFAGVCGLLTIGTIWAADIRGYVLRHIGSDETLNVLVEDQIFRPLSCNEILEPNDELILSFYYLRVMQAEKLRIFFCPPDRKEASTRVEDINFTLRNKIIKIHGAKPGSEEATQLEDGSLYIPRTKRPKVVPFPQKNISPLYFRNIDDIPLKFQIYDNDSLSVFQERILQPNEEFLLDIDYLKKRHLPSFTVITSYKKYTHHWKELHRNELPSPYKDYPFDKVWNDSSLFTGCISKHFPKPGSDDREYVAVRGQPGVSFKEFYRTCTGLYKQREKPTAERELDNWTAKVKTAIGK